MLASSGLFLTGCSESETIRVYQVPKDKVIEQAERHFPGDGHDHDEAPLGRAGLLEMSGLSRRFGATR